MKVLIKHNKEKDLDNSCLENLCFSLEKNQIEYVIIGMDESFDEKTDAVFAIGGDGTILKVVEYANKFSVPILGINAGKLGFLSEFEKNEIDDAIRLFKDNELKEDKRVSLKISYKDKVFYALNDAVVERLLNKEHMLVVSVSVSIDGKEISKIIGDGVIVSTPTGSTAYSLSAGGAILSPGINAFSITSIATHSFNNRPIVFSADSICELRITDKCSSGLFVDGKLVSKLKKGEKISIEKSDKPTLFLRKKTSDFYRVLSTKLKDRGGII